MEKRKSRSDANLIGLGFLSTRFARIRNYVVVFAGVVVFGGSFLSPQPTTPKDNAVANARQSNTAINFFTRYHPFSKWVSLSPKDKFGNDYWLLNSFPC